MSHDWLMVTLERRHGLITVLKPHFLPKSLRSTNSVLAFGSWFTSFSRVLPTSRVGYHAGKPIESVVYCLNNPLVFTTFGRCEQFTSDSAISQWYIDLETRLHWQQTIGQLRFQARRPIYQFTSKLNKMTFMQLFEDEIAEFLTKMRGTEWK